MNKVGEAKTIDELIAGLQEIKRKFGNVKIAEPTKIIFDKDKK